jgi:hypothetical protein
LDFISLYAADLQALIITLDLKMVGLPEATLANEKERGHIAFSLPNNSTAMTE